MQVYKVYNKKTRTNNSDSIGINTRAVKSISFFYTTKAILLKQMESKDMNSIPIPVLYNRKEECCGCAACYSICSKQAIFMIEDKEGFLYPKIDDGKCVRCEMCLEVCPIKVAKKK